MEIQFRHIARAVIVHENKLLIARMKGAHAFLPGGGIELGEGAQNALRRELNEELGVACDIGRFLGVLETHRFDERGAMHHEISHLFEVSSALLQSHTIPQSHEEHLAFQWIELETENIKQHNVLPPVLQDHLANLIHNPTCTWITTFSAPNHV
ncbi:NUDIX domain-containing protein [Paenibacillus terrigena]|uniref:NUDIX domain-containing protein n=1 Tax=Paenibacillus terrigena TaxID=369333 RepID=UPI000366C203|nr:NUDIX domain-containing protein [Paenibacillus terrigena]